ncbi:hypothetical protein FJZ19_00905 [Candidatus Pacearchaeota archaeon]|nr:hypothetical protein [Candidatus Pacearchaeota archaeon]
MKKPKQLEFEFMKEKRNWPVMIAAGVVTLGFYGLLLYSITSALNSENNIVKNITAATLPILVFGGAIAPYYFGYAIDRVSDTIRERNKNLAKLI